MPVTPKGLELAALPPGWDSYGSYVIDPAAIDRAEAVIELLSRPGQMVPTADGGISIEWHIGDRDFDLTFDPALSSVYLHLADDDEVEISSDD